MKELFQETIELYSKKKWFSFFISLFVKVYQEKDLCKILIKNFYDMNANSKGNVKGDCIAAGDPKLSEKFNSIIVKIYSESDSLINRMNMIRLFYGVLIGYLNFYDYSTFQNNINKLYKENLKIYMKYW